MKELEKHLCHGGILSVYEHESAVLGCMMKFSVFLPPAANEGAVPFLTYLSGLTCTHENFTTKGGAYGFAAKAGIAIIAPDTSPRGDHVPDQDSYDFGKGAGFYLNATQEPWAENYQMESYITQELNDLVCAELPLLKDKQGIFGHSMGGHGALVLGLKHSELYKSISAFAPITAPAHVAWGQKAFTGYLGDNEEHWHEYDACSLIKTKGDRSSCAQILIDQGSDDEFLDAHLKPHLFDQACKEVDQSLLLRMHEGYDHSYYFIQSFVKDHIDHHMRILAL